MTNDSREPTAPNGTSLDSPRQYLSAVASSLATPDAVAERLRHANHRQRLAIPLERDDGSVEVLDGYRVRHDDARGPYLGPHGYRPALSASACAGLATGWTVSAAIADVPFGGAAGGVSVDPSTLSAEERARLTRNYAAEVTGVGADDDVLVPGAGADGETMARLADALADRVEGPHRATVTGKPPSVGGTAGIGSAAGHSVALATENALEEETCGSFADSSVAVYGADETGRTVARLLDSWSARVVAMCADRVGLENDDGLDAGLAVDHLAGPGAPTDAGDACIVGTRNVLGRDADVLVATSPGIVTAETAEEVRASLVVEGVYGGVTPDGQRVLDERGVTVVPAVLARVGGPVAAHLEWIQSVGHDRWSDARVRNELGYALATAWDDVESWRETDGLTLREASYALGLSRVVDAHEVIR